MRRSYTHVYIGGSGSGKSTLLKCINLLGFASTRQLQVQDSSFDFSKPAMHKYALKQSILSQKHASEMRNSQLYCELKK